MTKLPAQKFLAYSRGEYITYEWQPPDVPDVAAPEHLADIYQHFRNWILERHGPDAPEIKSQIAIDDAGVRALLQIAFFASLRTDEDRPTRGTLYVESPGESTSMCVVTFGRPEPLTDALVAKLTPTLSADDSVLVVESHDGRLVTTGIANLDDHQSDAQPLVPPQGWLGRRGGLLIGIRGPGIISLRQGYCDYTLERNRVVGHVAAATIPPVAEWLSEMQKSLLSRAPKSAKDSPYFFREEDGHQDLDFVLSRSLTTASGLRHGAAIAVLSDVNTAPITITYPTNNRRSVKDLVQQFWSALGEAHRVQKTDQGPNAIARCERARHAMLNQAEVVGRLTATDGSVVLDRSFQVRGFGAIIDPALTTESGTLTFEPPETNSALTEADLLRRFGTRHRSAYLLCKACPHTIVFVLSQDGGWRVFTSDDKSVRFTEHVSP